MICTTYFLTFFSELIPPTGNYYIRNNNAEVLKALLEKIIAKMDEDKQLSSVTFVEHQDIFKELGFSVEKEWKRYVKMNKEN